MTNHKATSLMFGLAVVLCSSQSLMVAEEKQQIAPKVTFLVIYRPGPAWLAGKSVSEQPLRKPETPSESRTTSDLLRHHHAP